MSQVPDLTPWFRGLVAVTLGGVLLNLVLDGDPNQGVLVAGLVVFGALLPVWGWAARWPRPAYFGLVLGLGALVLGGLAVTKHPSALMALFCLLLPLGARMPRKYSVIGYVLFPGAACLVRLVLDPGPDSWGFVAGWLPGLLAVILFTETLVVVRRTAEENQRLLDELIEAQRKIQAEALPPPPAHAVFTRRETEVLSLVAKGFTNKEIAQRLFLAEGTVKNRVSGILEKIQVRDRTQAALRARELGIL